MSNESSIETVTNEQEEKNRDKAVRLFTYLKEVCQLRFVKILDCRNYEQLLWFHDIPQEPECHCIAWNEQADGGEAWIEVRRGLEPVCPPLTSICKDWISPADLANSAQKPSLQERILATAREGEAPSYIELVQKPAVRARWQEYLAVKWEPWAKEHLRWKRIQQVYGKLFSIYQQQKRLGEAYELRIGLGLLSLQTATGQRVYRHLIVGEASINFDANRGVITVQAAAEGAKLTLEHDMLEPGQLPTPEQHQAVEDGVHANAETPWDRNLIEPLLRMWVHAMSEGGGFSDSLQPVMVATSRPQITLAPALILRRRTAKTLVKLLSDIARNIAQGGRIPFGVQRLCEIVKDVAPDDVDEAPSETAMKPPALDAEVYFPLLANEEQSRIVQRLSTGRGVLVQGPPGTGKSHTIANLICHLLAIGKRVLVTSQTPRALKVLQEKIPPEISALCISILGNDTGAMKNMENSVLSITERHHDWEAGGRERNAQNIRRLDERLFKGRKRMAEIDERLRQLRELETYLHSIADSVYQGTAAQIAQKLVAERDCFGWFQESVPEKQALPIAAVSFLRVLHLLRSLPLDRCAELNRPFASINALPDVDTFVRIANDELAAKDVCKSHSSRETSPNYRTLVDCDREERRAAQGKLQALQISVGRLRHRPLSWLPKALHGVLSDQDRQWRELHYATSVALEGLCERARTAHARHVQLPNGIEGQRVLADARDLHNHLSKGGGLGFLFFRSAVVRQARYITEQVRVNGRVCATTETLAELIEHLDLEMHVEMLWGYWAGITDRIAGPLPRQVAVLEACQEALELVVSVIPVLKEAKAAVRNLRGIIEPAWQDDLAVGYLIADLQAASARDALLELEAQLSPVVHLLACAEISPNAHPVNAALSKAVLTRDVKVYSDAWNELRKLADDKQRLETRETIFESIKTHTPRLADLLAGDPSNSVWDERLPQIERAWNWSRANAWLNEFHRDQDGEKLEAEAKSLQKSLQHTMAELAAEKAWQHCFERLTESQRQHLMAWTNAVRRIGRGTGVRAEIHRRDARMHMDECRGAVPAWIMPFYRLAETIEAQPESFDVVIVDEASQSGPDTLALLYLAKQIIVVGDDQQISPEAVGVQRADVDLLSERLISDLPMRDALGAESSLFNQAVIRFGRRIVLREHFRCVPEIIRFSNDLCYIATPLVPLRQYPPARLEPIVVRHVAEGFREGCAGYARNRPEAEALVAAIVQCSEDARYRCAKDDVHPNGKLTFGVISLQGEEQAKLINQLLLECMKPEEIEQRELVCGDAYAFQGDERDVVFLSMVAAPNQRFAALVKESDKQRFNVAASRARDQVWLFHTVTLNELNPDDMRYKLLAYYSNPAAQPAGTPDWEKCDSEFERDVGRMICTKNYRVIPQYEPFGPGSYRIDFVVEGLKARLAVECDGPHHDDSEQIARDMARQLQLERCKWVFWRVSASNFYFDREKAMSSLWRILEEMGIQTLEPSVESASPVALHISSLPTIPLRETVKMQQNADQLDLIPPPQLSLQFQAPPLRQDNSAQSSAQSVGSTVQDVVSQIIRSHPNGFFPRDALCDVISTFLGTTPKIERKELICMVMESLNLPETDGKRVLAAIEQMELLGQLRVGSSDSSVERV